MKIKILLLCFSIFSTTAQSLENDDFDRSISFGTPSGVDLGKLKEQKKKFYETKINQYKEAQQCANLAKDVDSLNDCSKIFEREIKAYQEKNKGK